MLYMGLCVCTSPPRAPLGQQTPASLIGELALPPATHASARIIPRSSEASVKYTRHTSNRAHRRPVHRPARASRRVVATAPCTGPGRDRYFVNMCDAIHAFAIDYCVVSCNAMNEDNNSMRLLCKPGLPTVTAIICNFISFLV